MTSAAAGTLDEACERLPVTGPEFGGFLANDGPMPAEAMPERLVIDSGMAERGT